MLRKVRIENYLEFQVITDFSGLQGERKSVISIVLCSHIFLASVEMSVAGSDKETLMYSFMLAT